MAELIDDRADDNLGAAASEGKEFTATKIYTFDVLPSDQNYMAHQIEMKYHKVQAASQKVLVAQGNDLK